MIKKVCQALDAPCQTVAVGSVTDLETLFDDYLEPWEPTSRQ